MLPKFASPAAFAPNFSYARRLRLPQLLASAGSDPAGRGPGGNRRGRAGGLGRACATCSHGGVMIREATRFIRAARRWATSPTRAPFDSAGSRGSTVIEENRAERGVVGAARHARSKRPSSRAGRGIRHARPKVTMRPAPRKLRPDRKAAACLILRLRSASLRMTVVICHTGSRTRRARTMRPAWRAAQEYIAAGDIYQVNLAQRFTTHPSQAIPTASSSICSRAARRRAGRVPSTFDDTRILSASPELFLRIRGRHVTTRPHQGHAPRATATRCATSNSLSSSRPTRRNWPS